MGFLLDSILSSASDEEVGCNHMLLAVLTIDARVYTRHPNQP